MKKAMALLMALWMVLIMTGCGMGRAGDTAAGEMATTGENTGGTSPATGAETGDTTAGETGRAVVVYFSRTNNTAKIAGYIAEITGAAQYAIVAKQPYTDADINYNNADSRTSKEQNDPAARPEMGGEPLDLAGYDTVYLGYPIWWGQAPKILYTFVESQNLAGKTVVPFCTSASSGVGQSAVNLAKSAPDARWLAGKRFAGTAGKNEVNEWLAALWARG